jgi:hypothetical protein
MTNEERMVEAALRSWKLNEERVDKFFQALSEEQLQREVAPGRNRLIYLWGHLAAVNDALFPLFGLGPKLFPELEEMFISNPDRSVEKIFSGAELKQITGKINDSLWAEFKRWTPSEWLAAHTSVSDEDFIREPHRNRYSVLLSRNAHMAFHLGQAILVKPKR